MYLGGFSLLSDCFWSIHGNRRREQGGNKEGPEPHKHHLEAPYNHPNTPPEAPKSFSKIIPAMAHELVSVAYQES